jgi:hypothetical protein
MGLIYPVIDVGIEAYKFYKIPVVSTGSLWGRVL